MTGVYVFIITYFAEFLEWKVDVKPFSSSLSYIILRPRKIIWEKVLFKPVDADIQNIFILVEKLRSAITHVNIPIKYHNFLLFVPLLCNHRCNCDVVEKAKSIIVVADAVSMMTWRPYYSKRWVHLVFANNLCSLDGSTCSSWRRKVQIFFIWVLDFVNIYLLVN